MAVTVSCNSPDEVNTTESCSRVRWSMLLRLYNVPASVKFPDSVMFQDSTVAF